MKRLQTEQAYKQTKAKLADLKRRLSALESRTDLTSLHKSQALRSYRTMMRQYSRDIKLFEATCPERAESAQRHNPRTQEPPSESHN